MTSIPPVLPDDEPDLSASNPYETEYEIGQDNVEVIGLDVHNPVFFTSAALAICHHAGDRPSVLALTGHQPARSHTSGRPHGRT